MRIIAGEFRRRLLKSIPGDDIRPTPDRLRETLFNVLAPTVVGSVFVDAYAGTGAVGIEALSRGALRAIFIEKNRVAVDLIKANLASLQAIARAEVHRGKALDVLPRITADIVFLDPPYPLEREYVEPLDLLGNKPGPLVIVQHPVRLDLNDAYGGIHRTRVIRQGDNCLSFFGPTDAAPTDPPPQAPL